MSETESDPVDGDDSYRAQRRSQETELTEKQAMAYFLQKDGYEPEEIATHLGISRSSVYTHRKNAEEKIEDVKKTFRACVEAREVTVLPQFADRFLFDATMEQIDLDTDEFRIAQLIGIGDYDGNTDYKYCNTSFGLWAELYFLPGGRPFSPVVFFIYQSRDLVTTAVIEQDYLQDFLQDWLNSGDGDFSDKLTYNTNQDHWAAVGLYREDSKRFFKKAGIPIIDMITDDRYRSPLQERNMKIETRGMVDEPRNEKGKDFLYYEPSPEEIVAIENGETELDEETCEAILKKRDSFTRVA